MPRILIETYRTWDIWFDTNDEKFVAENGVNENEKGKPTPTLAVARKFIDDFRKANAQFTPFEVVNVDCYGMKRGETLQIIGVRKDRRYIFENQKGEKGQISEYSESDWALPNPDNAPALAEIARLREERDKLDKLVSAQEKLLVWNTLKEYKKTQDYSDFVA